LKRNWAFPATTVSFTVKISIFADIVLRIDRVPGEALVNLLFNGEFYRAVRATIIFWAENRLKLA
jgi:hypothetical protein